MDFMEAVKTCFKKYATFKGRAGRPEFWYWVLFIWILYMVAYTIDIAIGGDSNPMTRSLVVSNIVLLVIALPTVAVSVRRLHDVNRSGWWYLLTFTVIGALLLLYWYVRPGKDANRLVDLV